jgi:hypothetical protein
MANTARLALSSVEEESVVKLGFLVTTGSLGFVAFEIGFCRGTGT